MWRNENFPFGHNYPMNYNYSPWYSIPHPKRKISMDSLDEDLPPAKICISEERMVSQLNGIHLSNDFTSHGKCSAQVEESQMNGETLPKLTICEEIKNMPTTSTQILPRQILERCRRPMNALVLWQPPTGDLGKLLGSIKEAKNEDEEKQTDDHPQRDVDMIEDDNNNNNEQIGSNRFFGRTI
ncbi:uncharacterized protein LOC106668164 [Cimex lectularius]|uniref:Uncharacterized protein n=1 Tax=Cimex lectularius TaxID=79782 RepID=A0A8I6RXV4_CIMLE|nr:uncharacterized protein LOC106668164 [Cimex lectularius]XP_014252157.1 uncharacterized protein LOC106668164 [Cimex lectularius]XP_014252158.1 uncharacterized protein LOC106668164 [Cimex lectularius]XP_014252160.1 uncharacterized protein LOC106668164 [Cimex lectularius]